MENTTQKAKKNQNATIHQKTQQRELIHQKQRLGRHIPIQTGLKLSYTQTFTNFPFDDFEVICSQVTILS